MHKDTARMLAGLNGDKPRQEAEESGIVYADTLVEQIKKWREEGRSETWINYALSNGKP